MQYQFVTDQWIGLGYQRLGFQHGHDTMGNISEQNIGDDELIPRFWWKLFFHPSPDILAKQNTKETASMGNIWGPFNKHKGEGLGVS